MDDETFAFYLQQLHSNNAENAFMYLLEDCEASDIPNFIAAFKVEADLDVQLILLELIWQQWVPEPLNFLATILQYPNSKLWLEALDGIMVIGMPLAMTILETEKRGCSQ